MHRPRPIDLDIRRRRLKAADSFAPVSGRAEPRSQQQVFEGRHGSNRRASGRSLRVGVQAKCRGEDLSFGAMQQPLIRRTDPRYDSEHHLHS